MFSARKKIISTFNKLKFNHDRVNQNSWKRQGYYLQKCDFWEIPIIATVVATCGASFYIKNYQVASSSQYLAITGLGINNIKILKTSNMAHHQKMIVKF